MHATGPWYCLAGRGESQVYPVLYLIDAQWNFDQARATTRYPANLGERLGVPFGPQSANASDSLAEGH
jgi:hypothetical protein